MDFFPLATHTLLCEYTMHHTPYTIRLMALALCAHRLILNTYNMALKPCFMPCIIGNFQWNRMPGNCRCAYVYVHMYIQGIKVLLTITYGLVYAANITLLCSNFTSIACTHCVISNFQLRMTFYTRGASNNAQNMTKNMLQVKFLITSKRSDNFIQNALAVCWKYCLRKTSSSILDAYRTHPRSP